jgi:hypothetical protein
VNSDEGLSTSDPTNLEEPGICKVFAIVEDLPNSGEPPNCPEPENFGLAANTDDLVAAASWNVGDDGNNQLPRTVWDFVTTRETISCCERNDFEPANGGDFVKLREDENPAVLVNVFVAAIDAELENSGDLNVKGHPAGKLVPATKAPVKGNTHAPPFPVIFQKLKNPQLLRGDMSKIVLTKEKPDWDSALENSTMKELGLRK